jgi:heptaprenyl diphosphate synthase
VEIPPRDELGAALEIISEDLERIEKLLFEASLAATTFLSESTTYLTKAGGKRLRPALAVLSSMLGSGSNRQIDLLAAAVEMTHLATLYHDDVIDEADLRRGVPSVRQRWDNTVAILAGDYLFARAAGLAADVGGETARTLADAIARVVQGQVRELEFSYDPKRTQEHYFTTIDEKTASLTEASTRLGSALAGCPKPVVEAMSGFGSAFGIAFQVADDLLDLSASSDFLGKPPGTDLRDGVYTLPVIFAVEVDPSLGAELGGRDIDLASVQSAVAATGAFDKALEVSRAHAERALGALEAVPPGPARSSLELVTNLMIERVPALAGLVPPIGRTDPPIPRSPGDPGIGGSVPQ